MALNSSRRLYVSLSGITPFYLLSFVVIIVIIKYYYYYYFVSLLYFSPRQNTYIFYFLFRTHNVTRVWNGAQFV